MTQVNTKAREFLTAHGKPAVIWNPACLVLRKLVEIRSSPVMSLWSTLSYPAFEVAISEKCRIKKYF